MKEITAFIIGDKTRKLSLAIEPLTEEEKKNYPLWFFDKLQSQNIILFSNSRRESDVK